MSEDDAEEKDKGRKQKKKEKMKSQRNNWERKPKIFKIEYPNGGVNTIDM
jgi:hypothetical protein